MFRGFVVEDNAPVRAAFRADGRSACALAEAVNLLTLSPPASYAGVLPRQS